MFATGVRQARFGLCTVLGLPFKVETVEGLVRDALATLAEFGAPGDDVAAILDGPYADPSLAAELRAKALRRTARRLDVRSAFYRKRFAKAGVDPRRLTTEEVAAVPVTDRGDLADPEEFLCGEPFLSSSTTGTTGRPAQIWFSSQEMRLWPAMIALSQLLRGELLRDDRIAIAVSSRATSPVQQALGACRLAGVRCRVTGVLPVADMLEHLTGGYGPPPTVLQTYPSYLGALLTAARERGLGPDDFALRAITTMGELLTVAVRRGAEETFGVRSIVDSYGATEIAPAGGRVCTRRHLHTDPTSGYAEVVGLAGDAPAGPGDLGTLVVTPYYPFRECMPVFRYDTRDVVRRLPDRPTDCELAALPAVSEVLGKATGLLPTDRGLVTPRQLVEAVEGLPGVPWPARFAASPVDGRIRLTVPRSYTRELTVPEIVDALAACGVDAEIRLAPGGDPGLRPVRGDLVETGFAALWRVT